MAASSSLAGTSAWQSHLKAAGGVLGGAALVWTAPLTGGLSLVAIGAAAFARNQCCSDASAFDEELDSYLRSIDASGGRFEQIQRFSKRIDRLHCDFGCSPTPTDPVAPTPTKQELTLMRHSGIVLRLARTRGRTEWIKVEFVKEGLKHEVHSTEVHIQSSYLIERCRLNSVRPAVVADCLRSSRHHTYSALGWNCNHVADMVYEAVLASSSENTSVASASAGSSGNTRLTSALSSSPASGSALEENPCKICFESPRNAMFVPCGHFCSCMGCADRVSVCPLCNARIDARQRVYDG